jgi:hypothetical protein
MIAFTALFIFGILLWISDHKFWGTACFIVSLFILLN